MEQKTTINFRGELTPGLRKALLLCALVVAVMLGLSVWAWQQLPENVSIPVHWNTAGQPDRYGGKFEGLMVLPLVSAGVILLFSLIRYIDPLRANIERSMTAYRATMVGVLLFMLALHLVAVLNAVGYPINMGYVAAPAVGLLFIVLGNYMGKIRRNYMFGVRTPWTLASELSWNKTHRVMGKLFVLAGVLVLLAGLWGPMVSFYTMMVSILGSLLVGFGYSYWVWKHDPATQGDVV